MGDEREVVLSGKRPSKAFASSRRVVLMMDTRLVDGADGVKYRLSVLLKALRA